MKTKIIIIILIAVAAFLFNFKIIYGVGNSMYPTIKNKSLMLCKYTNNYKVGDIVFYKINGNLVVHRIVGINQHVSNSGMFVSTYTVQGDNNNEADTFPIFKENIICKIIKY